MCIDIVILGVEKRGKILRWGLKLRRNVKITFYLCIYIFFHGCLSMNHFILVPEIEKQF